MKKSRHPQSRARASRPAPLPPPGEFGYIDWLRPQCPGHPLLKIPSGDDCAALRIPAGQELLYAIDSVIDSVHFNLRRDGIRAAARKAVLRNVSDIAAMGGTPLAVVAAGGLPARFSARAKAELFAGLADACRAWRMALAGGDVAQTPGPLWLSVSILGLVPAGTALRRDTARPGDRLYVTGRLGGSIHGKHLDFTPRVAEGVFLRKHKLATACMDLSDGLAQDLQNLCKASRVGAVVTAADLPVAAAAGRSDRIRHALCDGEDFELLFTVRPADEARLLRCWPRTLAPIACVGTIRPRAQGLQLRDPDGRVRRFAALRLKGWEHRV